ncbi:Gr64e [Trypoxylus dichotomus]
MDPNDRHGPMAFRCQRPVRKLKIKITEITCVSNKQKMTVCLLIAEIKISEWTEIRRQYNRVYELCNRLEDKISPIILLSFSSNLYFVLVQLHGSVEKRDTFVERMYFFYSFGLLLLRTLAVCLFVARIDDESKATLRLMGCLRAFNSESKRLLQQISSTKMALSGMNFFTVTRGLILNRIAFAVQISLKKLGIYQSVEGQISSSPGKIRSPPHLKTYAMSEPFKMKVLLIGHIINGSEETRGKGERYGDVDYKETLLQWASECNDLLSEASDMSETEKGNKRNPNFELVSGEYSVCNSYDVDDKSEDNAGDIGNPTIASSGYIASKR